MWIKIAREAMCGKVVIPANDYWVNLGSDGHISLSAKGNTIQIKAINRKKTSRQKTTSVQFYGGGGKTWSLVVSTPKQGEWVAFIEYGIDSTKA